MNYLGDKETDYSGVLEFTATPFGDSSLMISGDATNSQCGIYFHNTKAWMEWCEEPMVTIDLICGCKREYNSKSEMEEEQCEHGNWFIKVRR